MKSILMILILLIGIGFTAKSQTGTLTVTVIGIQPDKGGAVSAGIFRKADFPKDGMAFMTKNIAVTSKSMTMTFTGVPVGEYGVAIYQDKDSSKSLNTNLVGLPKEPIGFSNDARINFGPPSFEDARIAIEEGKTMKITVELR
jgi:uncharacterized protein (DUF2141 family)